MVRRSEAPPPGWYPDPTGRSGLLWWDGLDWTTHHRPAPPSSSYAAGDAGDARAGRAAEAGDDTSVPSAAQLRSRAAAGLRQRREQEREVVDAVAEARRVAKAEVDRAVSEATRQLTSTRDRWQPRVEAYLRRFRRWLRITAVVVVVLVALSTWASATMQTSLLEWLGERIDAATDEVN